MPSLVRFLMVIGLLGGLGYAGLYVLAHNFEPPQREVEKPLPAVKIKK